MPVSLDKTPAPRPEDMDVAPTTPVEFRKLTGVFFVVSDDEGQWPNRTNSPFRDVLHVERASNNDVERHLQRDVIAAELAGAPGHTLTEVYAKSAGHAAGLARREFFYQVAVSVAEKFVRDAR
ncbi:hypothetical protein [Streptomyces sp. BH055]|uniref:hypothetical protein n=1 Tax=unclassified Streptomyces TaxID=2593676 RepID=UPI003BB77829